MTLPTPKMERWKYTNLPARLKDLSLSAGAADITFSGATSYVSPFPDSMSDVPSWVKEVLERPAPGVEKYKDMMLWQAANDEIKNGFIIDVPENTQMDKPLEVTFTGYDQTKKTARQIIRVQKNATAIWIDYQLGAGTYWHNVVTQIELEEGATLYHYRFQENSDQAIITQNTHIVMGKSSEYEAFTMTSGARLSRNQIHVDMIEERASCKLNGVNMLDGSELADATITVEHVAPNCNSFQNYRNVVKDKSVAVFQGKVHVHQEAQKTDANQMVRSLLLSQQATVNTKPELEIYADDVKCSHGATTGCLDDKALFYLRSRGIPEKEARDLLVQAFVSEILEEITNKDARAQAEHIITHWLAQEESNSNQDWLEE